jgi:hypothetical protein
MWIRLAPLVAILALTAPCQVSVKVSTSKPAYLVGEPVWVVVDVRNTGTEPIGYSYCDSQVELSVENFAKRQNPNLCIGVNLRLLSRKLLWTGHQPDQTYCGRNVLKLTPMPNLWGCSGGNWTGGGSCGIDHPPTFAPGESVSFRYLLKDYNLVAGAFVLRAKGKAGMRWKYYPDMGRNPRPAPINPHKDTDPVEGAEFDATVPITVTAGSEDQLWRAYAPYLANADASRGYTEAVNKAREAIAEMAPAFLEKTILAFASGPNADPGLAVKGLGRIATAESRADLISLYRASSSLGLRASIAEVLAYMATSRETTFFTDQLFGLDAPPDRLDRKDQPDQNDERIRVWAALALGHIGDDVTLPILQRATHAPGAEVRRAVAAALGNLRSPLAVPALIDMYGDEDSGVSNAVCGVLVSLTHYAWCDGSVPEAAKLQARWRRWWEANGSQVTIHGAGECPAWNVKLPMVTDSETDSENH